MITEAFFFFNQEKVIVVILNCLNKSFTKEFNTECQEIMGSNKKSKQCGFNNLNQNFLGGDFIQDVFDELIFNPLKLKGIITIFKYKFHKYT